MSLDEHSHYKTICTRHWDRRRKSYRWHVALQEATKDGWRTRQNLHGRFCFPLRVETYFTRRSLVREKKLAGKASTKQRVRYYNEKGHEVSYGIGPG